MALTDKLAAIAAAIRSKTGKTAKLSLSQMVDEIDSIRVYEPPVYDTPSISVSSGGLITASANGKSNTKQLTTQAATSITPTKSQQTAVASGRYTTGEVTVAAIPAQYIIPSGSETKTANGTYDVTALAEIVVNVSGGGGGIDGIAYGTHTQGSNVTSTTNTKITDVSTIGFTPKHFYMWRDGVQATNYHIHKYTFDTFGTTYSRTYGRYATNTSTVTTTGAQTAWTTQTNGHLYFNSNNIYVRSTSSYVFPQGTWHWLAVRD